MLPVLTPALWKGLVGSVAAARGQDHLLLHRVKDDTEWLSMMDWSTAPAAGWTWPPERGRPESLVLGDGCRFGAQAL